MSKTLLAFDADRIKNYVFATGKLKEIRGASAILDEFNRKQMVEIVEEAGGEKIYANGGGGLFVVDTPKAVSIKNTVEKLYHSQTHTASITGAMVEQSGDFQSDYRVLGYRLRHAKNDKNKNAVLVTHSYLHFCDSCGTEYAVQKYKGDATDEILLCASCVQKREKDKAIKENIHRIVGRTVNESGELGVGLWSQLIPLLHRHGYPVENYDRPEDFSKLAGMCHSNNYIGLIYADGDSMGKELEKLKSKSDLQKFSEVVDHSMHEAVAKAISIHLRSDERETWPFDILLLGGDDLVMVTPASKIFEVGLTVMETFTRLTQKKLGYPLNLSVGIVIAHPNFPFGQLLSLAESTLKFAKKEGAKRRQAGKTWEGGLLNFLVVNSANHLAFEAYYDDVLAEADDINDNTKNLFRTLRPYNAVDFRELIGAVKRASVRKMPRNKLQQIRRAIFKSRKQAMIDGLTILFHWRNEKQREAIQEIVSNFAQRNQNGNSHGLFFPWYPTGEKAKLKYYTPLLDLIELSAFIAVPNQGETNG